MSETYYVGRNDFDENELRILSGLYKLIEKETGIPTNVDSVDAEKKMVRLKKTYPFSSVSMKILEEIESKHKQVNKYVCGLVENGPTNGVKMKGFDAKFAKDVNNEDTLDCDLSTNWINLSTEKSRKQRNPYVSSREKNEILEEAVVKRMTELKMSEGIKKLSMLKGIVKINEKADDMAKN